MAVNRKAKFDSKQILCELFDEDLGEEGVVSPVYSTSPRKLTFFQQPEPDPVRLPSHRSNPSVCSEHKNEILIPPSQGFLVDYFLAAASTSDRNERRLTFSLQEGKRKELVDTNVGSEEDTSCLVSSPGLQGLDKAAMMIGSSQQVCILVGGLSEATSRPGTYAKYTENPKKFWTKMRQLYKISNFERIYDSLNQLQQTLKSNGKHVSIITSEVDSLLMASNLYEVNGSLNYMICASKCTRAPLVSPFVMEEVELECPCCTAACRPFINFEDEIKMEEDRFGFADAFEALINCDLVLILGEEINESILALFVSEAMGSKKMIVELNNECLTRTSRTTFVKGD